MNKLSLILLFIFLSCTHSVKLAAPSRPFDKSAHHATSTEVMVSTQGESTTTATIGTFKSGGNIIDAFVTASLCISVERPHSTGLGGGGFLTYFDQKTKKVYAFDFRERAPLKSTKNMFLTDRGEPQPKLSQEGALAVASPGLLRGLYAIHKRFGKLPWKDVVSPAVSLARNGFPLYDQLHLALTQKKDVLKADPEVKAIFFTNDESIKPLGSIIKQELLASSLEKIALEGDRVFYEGEIATALVETVREKKGNLRYSDLKQYKMIERNPIVSRYDEVEIFSMPPPSSGGVHIVQILKMLEPFELKKYGPQSVEATHLIAQAMRRAFLDRASYMGDPDFHKIPVKKLISSSYLKALSKDLSFEKVGASIEMKKINLPHESTDTTHFSIGDQFGNLVASTQTINGWFGAGFTAKGTGIFYNNEMDDFAQKIGAQNLFGAVGGQYNLIAPRKTPLSSMSPTIVLKNKQAFLALGSPSGTRIITCVTQAILNRIEFEMPLYESIAATRIHHQWSPDELKIEFPYLAKNTEEKLKNLGHQIKHEDTGCSVQAIEKTPQGWIGVSDPRNYGLSLGF